MKPWLVDVPVKINIWIRPELQKKQWDVIKQARPRILFIQSDGGRNEEEWAAIKQNRELIDTGIDWECEVHKLYENENLGLYTMGAKRNKYIWEHVDRCIFLEDDHIPSISYFRFCSELLEQYKDDFRIEAICGYNNANQWDAGEVDYFFSRRGSIWGIATWRSRHYIQNISDYKNDAYFLRCVEAIQSIDKPIYQRIHGYMLDDFYENHRPGTEFWHRFNVWAENRLFIVASKNMISCQGATVNSAHACRYDKLPNYIKPLFNSKTYEVSFPLKRPNYMINDEKYARFVEKSLGENRKKKKLKLFKKISIIIREHRFFRVLFRKIRKVLIEKINNKHNKKSSERIIEK